MPTSLKYILGATLGLAVAFAAGRYTAPTHVKDESIHIVETSKLRQQVTDLEQQVVAMRHEASERNETEAKLRTEIASIKRSMSRRSTREETRPDGTKIVTKTETNTATEATKTSTTDEKKVTTETKIVDETKATDTKVKVATTEVETGKVTDIKRHEESRVAGPNWLVGIGAGYSAKGGNLVNVPGVPDEVVGVVTVDRKVLGPLWVGGWGSSTGAIGVSVKVAF